MNFYSQDTSSTRSTASELYDSFPSSVPISERKRHETLWFNDGTIILATATVIFRVYGGILAHFSPIFQDMFSLSQPTSTSTKDNIYGIPVVEVHDEPGELEHLLSALHYRLYFQETDGVNYDMTTAILLLSTKYQIQSLREQAIRQLLRHFPDTLDALTNPKIENPMTIGSSDELFALLRIARKTDVLQLLPITFYRLSILLYGTFRSRGCLTAIEEQHFFLDHLSDEDFATLTYGREKLRRSLREVIGAFIYKPSPSGCRTNVRCVANKAMILVSGLWIRLEENPAVLDHLLSTRLVEALQNPVPALCATCIESLRTSMQEGRRKIWDKLPSFFGLPDWETMRARTALSAKHA